MSLTQKLSMPGLFLGGSEILHAYVEDFAC